MIPTVEPRPETCGTCGQPHVHPKVMRVQRGTEVVLEAHWIWPRCTNRFKVGTVRISDEKKQN